MSTTLIFFVAQAHAAPSGAKLGVKAGILDGIANAGFMVQFLLVFMIALSIISWAIMYMKYKQFELLREANASFGDKFWKATSLETVFEQINDDPNSNTARVFKSAFLELKRLADSALAKTSSGESHAKLLGIDNLERAVRKSVDHEMAVAESKLGFLATVGSTSPFIGLLGTVVGIMTSFSNIAASGSASLAVVAPGISEALFSTAVGLFAALPAVAAYNYFVGQLRKVEMDLNSFGSDFLNIAKRNFFKE